MYKKLHIHFVGIGGIGMSGIAEVLINLGYPVSGSDLKKSAATARLKRLGAEIHLGHHEKNITGADVVVYSSAVKKTNNPEVLAALKHKTPVIRRAEMLAELMRLTKYGVAVAGTHGKTTTTSLLASVLHAGGMDPTVVIGGKLNSLKTNAKLGSGNFMVAEADESDGSFLHLMPTLCIVTNIDPDHLENFRSFKHYKESFFEFCQKIPFYGMATLCGEHPETAALAKRLDKRISLYGFSPKHDWNAQNITFVHTQSYFDLFAGEKFIDHIELNLSGRHNVLNALAVISVATELGVNITVIKKALKSFKGVGRRMEVLFKDGGVVAIDDYAHHPAEISATLAAVRNAFAGRLIVVFQPHRFTRLKNLYKEFTKCFALADELYLTKVYAAGESPIADCNAKKLADDLKRKQKNVRYLGSHEEISRTLLRQIKSGDILLGMGAGDITLTTREIARKLKGKFKEH